MSTLAELQIDAGRFERLIKLAIEEDLGQVGDLTSKLSAVSGPGAGRLIARQRGVLAGGELMPFMLPLFGAPLTFSPRLTDGAAFDQDDLIATVQGDRCTLLAAERTVLNVLQRLCGIATLTRRFVDAVAETAAQIYDTRKTTPAWRDVEKYAVRCGGGHNHRHGLHDAVLVKDNHLAGTDRARLGYVAFEILNRVAALDPAPDFVEFEVDDLQQLEALLKVVGIDVIMLDNFSIEDLYRAVQLRDRLTPRHTVLLEASGGVTLDTVRAVAETGVERISVGALTHSAVALDISLELEG